MCLGVQFGHPETFLKNGFLHELNHLFHESLSAIILQDADPFQFAVIVDKPETAGSNWLIVHDSEEMNGLIIVFVQLFLYRNMLFFYKHGFPYPESLRSVRFIPDDLYI